MKILNLYAGIGGNRKLWDNEHEITAIEINPDIAKIYQDFFPEDKVIITNAHQYLLDHYKEYDFIWSSPPCQSHSSFRQNIGVKFRNVNPVYPDMSLYQEILFLQYNFKNNWVIENVKPYYKPLIMPDFILERHCFWSNKVINPELFKKDIIRTAQIEDLQNKYNYDLSKYNIKNKRQILRNCVNPEIGKYILDYFIDLKEYLF